jgi:FdhD protein
MTRKTADKLSPPRVGSISTQVHRISGSGTILANDSVAIEEPLEIVLNHGDSRQTISITMRTPGHDTQLVSGFLYGEGVIGAAGDIAELDYWGPRVGPLNLHNTVVVELAKAPGTDLKRLERNFFTHAGCGICGKTALEALAIARVPHLSAAARVDAGLLRQLPNRMRKGQEEFDATGGLHAAAMFDASGKLVALFEDIGRHNAMDKLVGHLLQTGQLPVDDGIVVVSGRASFELVQKALMANFPVFVSVGAPSSLALDLAREYDLTLAGFTGEDRLNLYHGQWRIS